jgi:hypothetical protein
MANPSHALNVFRFAYIKDTNAGQATTPTQSAGKLNLSGTGLPRVPAPC